MIRAAVLLIALAVPSIAAAQTSTTGVGADVSAALSAVQATIPTAASAVPPIEAVGGAIGTAGTYRPASAVQPRITRATNCTLDATGSCSVTWATALTAAPTIVTTPINPTAAAAIMCNSTATPTTTGAAIKCWTIQSTTLTLAIVTAGLNLVPATTAAAGTVVQVIALPPTQ